MNSNSAIACRELDHRSSDGIEVRLLWNPQTDRVSVAVADQRRGEAFELAIRAGDAQDAFHHPYAYRAQPSYPAYDGRAVGASAAKHDHD